MATIAVNIQAGDYSLTGSRTIPEPGDLVAAKQLLDAALGRNGAEPIDRVELAAKLANAWLGGVRLNLSVAERMIAFLGQQGALRP